MKVSLTWLQKYFDVPLPQVNAVSDAFTFHAFEIDEVVGDMLDVKVLPNRAADCLSHRGLAKELSAILDIPMKGDPLREQLPEFPKGEKLSVTIEDTSKCLRYVGALVCGVKVGPSPVWLKVALESVGQRSINNVVDATNYVMLNIGQPLHAFDAGKLSQKEGVYAIGVRAAKNEEKITTLSNEVYNLNPNIMLITDAHSESAIGIAGVKGGKSAEVTADTTNIIIESANFEGTITRRAAQALKLFTDASLRFQNRPSPELAAYGMRDVLALVVEIAGGEVVEVVDTYPVRSKGKQVVTSLLQINALLGSCFTNEEVKDVFKRLSLPYIDVDSVYTVTPSFERTDIIISEDLAEEVGRILGYDRVLATELPQVSVPPDQARYLGIERMKDQLIEKGFTEVSTQSFAKKGDIYLSNPLDKMKPALRTSLEQNLEEARIQATHYAPLVLKLNEKPRLFEVGTVFLTEGEHVELRMSERVPEWGEKATTVDNLSIAKLEEYGKGYIPMKYELKAYKPFSTYPFMSRDIALWTPEGTPAVDIEETIRTHAGKLLVRLSLFDMFSKDGRVSYAFRLIFQSFERTLTSEEVDAIMGKITEEVQAKGFEVR